VKSAREFCILRHFNNNDRLLSDFYIMDDEDVFDIYIDGAAKNNPGPAGIGIIICRGNEVIKNISQFLGTATNNIAEYNALIRALEEAQNLGLRKIKINTDSQLLYRQLKRQYKVKNSEIKVAFQKALMLIWGFDYFDICCIPRTQNKGADKLANIAIKNALKKSG